MRAVILLTVSVATLIKSWGEILISTEKRMENWRLNFKLEVHGQLNQTVRPAVSKKHIIFNYNNCSSVSYTV